MRLLAPPGEFDQFLGAATDYWRSNILTPTSANSSWIITEALHQDIRVTLRNLTVANALRRLVPARVLVVTGTDQDWMDTLWQGFDVATMRRLCDAYGAETIDIHELVNRRIEAGKSASTPFRIPSQTIAATPQTFRQISAATLKENVDATYCRIKMIPHLPDGVAQETDYRRLARRSEEFSRVYDQLHAALRPIALVTSHVDYNQWGLGVESAMRCEIPVLHTQSTGSLKAYALFPSKSAGLPTFRAELTRQIGSYFEEHLWPARDLLHRSAELVAWRSKANLGRPSWWRGGATASADLRTAVEREQLRSHALPRFGFDPALPVVVVFNHAVSDALGTNHETFDDLADWFEQTASFASTCPKANWLFLDHPSQGLYDRTGFFDGLAAEHVDSPRVTFRSSSAVPKNILWSLIDLGVTVRGSVSNELPAYGIPVIQAGWSEWSACGMSMVADKREAYWDLLTSSIDRLNRGESLVTPEQIQRGRLWLWLYRCGADVATQLVPPWDAGDKGPLLSSLRVNMRHVESDGDPAFLAVDRMWTRQEPFLTRFDLGSTETLRHAMPRNLSQEG